MAASKIIPLTVTAWAICKINGGGLRAITQGYRVPHLFDTREAAKHFMNVWRGDYDPREWAPRKVAVTIDGYRP